MQDNANTSIRFRFLYPKIQNDKCLAVYGTSENPVKNVYGKTRGNSPLPP